MPNGDVYSGPFQVATLEYSGDHVSSQVFSFTLESSDTINYPLSYYQTIIADGPVVYYRLGETEDDTTAVDKMGNANATHVIGAMTQGEPSIIVGDANTSIRYLNANSRTIVTSPVVDLSGDLSYEMWFTIHSFDSVSNVLVGKRSGGNNAEINIWCDVRNARFRVLSKGVTGQVISNTVVDTLETTFYVVVTHNSITNTNILYVNGIFDNSAGGAVSYGSTAPMAIGSRPDAPYSQPVLSTVDEFALYDKVLTPDQILNHYNIGAGI